MSKHYSVQEMFYSIHGEGVNVGRPAVFCRFTGCNLWTGREEDRVTAICRFCDTDFLSPDPSGGKFSAYDLAERASQLWPGGARLNPGLTSGLSPLVILTGGEPMLQVDVALILSLQSANFEVAIETNGTIAVPSLIDWITVSPKVGTNVIQRTGQELKFVFPQCGQDPAVFLSWQFDHFFLQPMAGLSGSQEATIDYVRANPHWRISLQTHKSLGLR